MVLHDQCFLKLEVLVFSLLHHLVDPLATKLVLCYYIVLLLLKFLGELTYSLRMTVGQLYKLQFVLSVSNSELAAQALLSDLTLIYLFVFRMQLCILKVNLC